MFDKITKTELYFKKKEEIYSGGFGKIWLATDQQLDAEIAIKEIKKENFKSESEYYTEAKILYYSRNHNIAKIFYGCQDHKNIYLAMPYYKNGSLHCLINKRFLTANEIIRYSLQMLSGLHHIHSKRLIHFDIKPKNLLIGDDNCINITDFGISRFCNDFGVAERAGFTIDYMPPEYDDFKSHSNAFDIYSAGVTIYEICVGSKNFFEQINKVCNNHGRVKPLLKDAIKKGKFPDRKYMLPHIPNSLKRIIKKAIDIDLNNRYITVLEMMNALAKITDGNDWRFNPVTDEHMEWDCDNRKIVSIKNGGNWDVETRKNGKRQTKYCKKGLTEKEVNNFLYKSLHNK
jgi:serine/threonine protein kinase